MQHPWAGSALRSPGNLYQAVQEPSVRPVVFINSFLAQDDKSVDYDTFLYLKFSFKQVLPFLLLFYTFSVSFKFLQMCAALQNVMNSHGAHSA